MCVASVCVCEQASAEAAAKAAAQPAGGVLGMVSTWWHKASGYADYGLRKDDILEFEHDEMVAEAVRRLPDEEKYQRTFRQKVAMQASLSHSFPPKEHVEAVAKVSGAVLIVLCRCRSPFPSSSFSGRRCAPLLRRCCFEPRIDTHGSYSGLNAVSPYAAEQEDQNYLQPYIAQVQKEFAEKNEWYGKC